MPDTDKEKDVPVVSGDQHDAAVTVGNSVDTQESLDQLLDDALNDFDLPAPHSTIPRDEPQASVSSEVRKFEPLGKGTQPKSKAAKAMKFDPLHGRAPKASSGQASSQTESRQSGAGFGAVPPDVSDLDEELKRGLEELMKELADVDLSQQPQQQGEEERHGSQFSGTLRALSETQATLRQASGLPEGGPPGPDSFSDPIFAGLQQQLQGGSGQDALGSFADGIMQQLLSKDVLYQPMKDISERYPAWLEAHRGELPGEEMDKYEAQYRHIQTILRIYERDPDNFSELFGALQQMQACGQPPQDIVNDLAPGMSFDEDGLPKLPSPLGGGAGCPIQ